MSGKDEDSRHMTIRQAVAFAFLMGNNKGIMGKSPSYVLEKMQSCLEHRKPDEQIFHPTLKDEFDLWAAHWGVKW